MGRVKQRLNGLLERTTGFRLVRGQRTQSWRDTTAAQVRAGLVEEFVNNRVSGWIAVPASAEPVRVSLVVNDEEVTATWATEAMVRNNWGEVRSFAFRIRDLWMYSKKKYRITVRVGGKALPIAGHGMFLTPPRNGRQDLAALKAKMAEGYMFSHSGHLQLSKKLDTEWQSKVMGLYNQVREIVRETHGYDVFFIYGTLLGAVREGGPIAHDMDFDSAYVSKHTESKVAADELQEIAFLLVERGLDVECKRTALHIHDSSDPEVRIDLFHLYFDDSKNIQFPFGVAGKTDISTSDWQGTKEIDFCGDRGLIPVNAEQFAEHMYGATWHKPKPGFNWARDRTKRDTSGWMPISYGQEVYWSNFYMRTQFNSGSPFFETVNARKDMPGTVIDVGCGDGRDSFAFGKAGRGVLGLDRSQVGVRHASGKAEELGLDRVRFAACDVSDAEAFKKQVASVTADADGPILFYLRFFLHSLPEEVQETLMTAISEVARPGDMFAAEFRTDKDEALDKTYGKHYRRYQNGPAFGVALGDRYGFKVIEEKEGRGLSPYKDEDPELYRVVARHP